MPEKLNLTPDKFENQVAQPAIEADLSYQLEQPEEASQLSAEKSSAESQLEVDNLTEQARNLAEADSQPESLAEADSQPESLENTQEKYQQAVAELINQVGESGQQQIELLAHGSERLNGLRAVIETGFNPNQAFIENEIAAIHELIRAKRDLTRQDHQTHGRASTIVKDNDSVNYQADLNRLKIAINDETANKDKQLIDLVEAIPSQGEPSLITSAMEEAIEAMRERGSDFADSSTGKLMTLLKTMSKETSQD